MFWTHYRCEIKGRAAAVFVSTDFVGSSPRADLPWRYRVGVWVDSDFVPEKEFLAAVGTFGNGALVCSHKVCGPGVRGPVYQRHLPEAVRSSPNAAARH